MSELLSDLDLERSQQPAEPRDPGGPHRHGGPRTRHIERAIILMADAVWAVVGLFLWLPQIVRVVLTTALRLIHAALTRQPIDSIRRPIQRVSRFYVDGFLSPGGDRTSGGYGSRQLQLGRFLVEAVWVAVVWMAVLRWLNPAAFGVAWQGLARFADWSWTMFSTATATLVARIPEGVSRVGGIGVMPILVVALLLIAFLVAGFLLGRRRR